jgi:hypothetical protein
MNSKDINLASVNWEHGMLLSPEHFLRQERYFDSALLWAVRYMTPSYGLVGGGPRVAENERGAVRHDPVVTIAEDAESLSVSVTQCRAVTPAGCIIEIDPEHSVSRKFSKTELEGVAECRVYVVADPHVKEVVDGPYDEFNPQMQTERRSSYAIALRLDAEDVPYSVAVAKVRRQSYGTAYEKDASYIPACVAMVSYSELASVWRKIVETVTGLTDRYIELHRAMTDFLVVFTERGIETDLDSETLKFVDRMVVALQNCVYDILDPLASPEQFFANVRRFVHTAATYLYLSPAVQQYFDVLRESGETEFVALVEQQRKVLSATRSRKLDEDVSVEARAVMQSLGAVTRLEHALEGKYLDFHVSPSLEAMNFVFDRGGKVLYKIAAKPARVQGSGDELTIYFSQLRLEGRDKYRLILVGEQNASFERGTKIAIEVGINEGSGFRRQPIILSCEIANSDHRNFEFDFDAPDVPTITDFRVSLQAHLPFRTALLFVRHRFYAGVQEQPVRTMQARAAAAEAAASGRAEPLRDAPPAQPMPFAPARNAARVEELPSARVDEQPAPRPEERSSPRFQQDYGDRRAPWEPTPRQVPREPVRDMAREQNEPASPPPRRRRLE